MEQQSKEITNTIATDTSKMKLWQDAIKLAIWSDGSNILESNQIPIKLDKREKELAKKRAPNE
jgi:hypothetical protein